MGILANSTTDTSARYNESLDDVRYDSPESLTLIKHSKLTHF
ncbi:hypothetical protein RMSM_02117 [Rhodopirellula maiorica SM1]|uniref:Uncharacterized protein n=1 Tax=Rhodopirellula maiorica SM1 TaxID=1265738 RepID=M5RZX3_9BACT|nr:hypothetical protein RMSM_02117 [Rhodopirellula maiorica SM1]